MPPTKGSHARARAQMFTKKVKQIVQSAGSGPMSSIPPKQPRGPRRGRTTAKLIKAIFK
jgi:hypothetical protein